MEIRSNRIKDVIDYYSRELNDHFTEKECKSFLQILFEHYFKFSKIDIILNPEKTISESGLLKIHFAVKNLINHKPIQYITGKTNFFGFDFVVNPSVLIPRPETEELVQFILEVIKGKNHVLKILDIGTGSGCIAITLKKLHSNSEISAIDFSTNALEVAKLNATKNEAEIDFVLSDILNFNSWESFGKYDIIVSNPPYIRESEKTMMKKNVLDFEPKEALFVSDENPLIFYDKITKFAKSHLNKDGLLFFEINEELSIPIIGLLKKEGFKEIIIRKDINQKERMVKCVF
ncbi:MAG: peptide chain release factor N(5)-glutamine methyltransferase [Bacteroidales bacterium]|nr:peptide chain release factor N(5)-glutamine methyltransferase [Bacteroidales bacterium]